MVNFELSPDSILSLEEREQLAQAKSLPVVYDEDSPALDSAMEQAFAEARRRKPCRSKPLTLYVSAETLEKAKTIGDDYAVVLGRLLDKAVEELAI